MLTIWSWCMGLIISGGEAAPLIWWWRSLEVVVVEILGGVDRVVIGGVGERVPKGFQVGGGPGRRDTGENLLQEIVVEFGWNWGSRNCCDESKAGISLQGCMIFGNLTEFGAGAMAIESEATWMLFKYRDRLQHLYTILGPNSCQVVPYFTRIKATS